jgi:hypothetical protein
MNIILGHDADDPFLLILVLNVFLAVTRSVYQLV